MLWSILSLDDALGGHFYQSMKNSDDFFPMKQLNRSSETIYDLVIEMISSDDISTCLYD